MAQKLYVGNLPFSVTEDDLRELFAVHGAVHSINLITDRDTGRPRGFAFVEMDGADAATDALNGHEIDGRALKVSEAKERQPRSGGGRGDDGGGGGGGRNRW